MELKREFLHLDLPDRIAPDAARDRLFINFEKMRVRSSQEVERLRRQVETVLAEVRGKVDVVVNYAASSSKTMWRASTRTWSPISNGASTAG
jgi:propionate CoA-transferase